MTAGCLRFEAEARGYMRDEAVGLVRRVYARCYGTCTTASYPVVACVRDEEGAVVAAAGHRNAGTAPLFLEAYLDEPVERLVSRAVGRPVARDRIVEIGGLAASGRTALLALFGHLSAMLEARGFEVAVVTATAKLRRVFELIGFGAVVLGRPDPTRLSAPEDWGRYYDADPMVLTGAIGPVRARLERRIMLGAGGRGPAA